MAEKPIKTPLPADLPEDWNIDQTVAPDGTAVGLTEQHGYNYLMAAVNRAQRGVNQINDAFEKISAGAARWVVGTSTNGWTEADCDYLCDGTDDQVEIQQALNSARMGGEVVLLPGTYNLSGHISIAGCWLHGALVSTDPIGGAIIDRDTADGYGEAKSIVRINGGKLSDIKFNGFSDVGDDTFDVSVERWGHIENVHFNNNIKKSVYISGALSYISTRIVNCAWTVVNTAIYADCRGGLIFVGGNDVGFAQTFIETHNSEKNTGKINNLNVSIVGNGYASAAPGTYYLDDLTVVGGNVIQGNAIAKLIIQNSSGERQVNNGNIVSGNIINPGGDGRDAAIILGENTSGWFVTGNVLFEVDEPVDYYIEDHGTGNVVRFNSDDSGGSTPATVQQATPTITVNNDGKVTASATQAAGYVAAGTRSATRQLSSADDADLIPENIKEGVSIFGVTGTLQTGGGTAGVSSFNGRDGAVVPGNDDYTAPMVGAIPASAVKEIQFMTQSQYDALATKNAATLYLIKE